jgi:hypothetical protein
MAKITVQGYLNSLSNRPQGSFEEDLLQKRFESVSQQALKAASESKQPLKSSIATVMGDTLGKGLLRAFGVKDVERQRAIESDQASKLLQELQKKPMTSKNLMDMAAILQSQGQSESAVKAIELATQYDNNISAQQTTNVQRVNVANQAVKAGYNSIAARVGDGTLTPQQGFEEISKRQKQDAEAAAAAKAASTKNKGEVKVVDINGVDYLIDEQGNVSEPELPPAVVENMKREQDKKTASALLDVDNQLNALDAIEDLAINKGAAGELYNELSMHPTLSRLGSFTAGVADAVTFGAAGLGDETGSAYNLSRLLDPLKSDITFAKINALKSQSDTGATGLGQISNVEINLLQNSIAALDPAIGEEAFKQQLDRVRFHYQNVKDSLLGKPPQIDIDHPSYDSLVSEIEDNGQKVTGLAIGDTVYIRDGKL